MDFHRRAALASIAWAAYGETPPATASQTSVVMDAATGQVLVEKGMDHMMYPASITKIMTVLLALENGDPDKKAHSFNSRRQRQADLF